MKLRVWWIRNMPSKAEFTPVYSVEEGRRLLDRLAEEDLKNLSVVSNAGGMQGLSNNEWLDLCEECGRLDCICGSYAKRY